MPNPKPRLMLLTVALCGLTALACTEIPSLPGVPESKISGRSSRLLKRESPGPSRAASPSPDASASATPDASASPTASASPAETGPGYLASEGAEARSLSLVFDGTNTLTDMEVRPASKNRWRFKVGGGEALALAQVEITYQAEESNGDYTTLQTTEASEEPDLTTLPWEPSPDAFSPQPDPSPGFNGDLIEIHERDVLGLPASLAPGKSYSFDLNLDTETIFRYVAAHPGLIGLAIRVRFLDAAGAALNGADGQPCVLTLKVPTL